jgi:hypothetical protein
MLTNLESGNTPNWNQWLNYCVEYGKGIGFLEYGLYPDSTGAGGAWSVGDDVAYASNVHSLVRTAAASYNLPTIFLPWTQATGNSSSFVNFPNATAEAITLVASDVAAGLTHAPATSSLQITSVPAQSGTVGTPYAGYTLTATGGTPPYTFSILSTNPLPSGISLTNTSNTGVLAGTPTTAEDLTVDATVTDSLENSSTTSFGFNVQASGAPTPQYPPAGITIGSLLLNTVFSAQAANGAINFANFPGWAYWFNNEPPGMNGVELSASNVNIEQGQLVLTLASNTSGGAIATTTHSGGGLNIPQPAYFEFDLIVPGGGWWAAWIVVPGTTPYGEADFAENGSTGAAIYTNYHGPGGNEYNGGAWSPMPTVGERIVVGGFWEAGQVQTWWNGAHVKTLVNGDGGITIGSTPEGIVLNIGENGGPTPQYLKVYSVRVWAVT